MSPEQLALDVRIHQNNSFENFYAGDNAEIATTLKNMLQKKESGVVYIWGKSGVGCSHLLQASCDFSTRENQRAFYLSLKNTNELSPTILDGLEHNDLLCIDDMQAIAGDARWERAIFNIYNSMLAQQHTIFFAANNVPQSIGIQLPDLCSRLTAGVIFHVRELGDEQKKKALQLRAQRKGLQLSEQVVKFMLLHCPRNLGQLLDLLDRLDQKSLGTKRAITIPLLKELL